MIPKGIPITTPASSKNPPAGKKYAHGGKDLAKGDKSAGLDTGEFGAKDISAIYNNNLTRHDALVDESGQHIMLINDTADNSLLNGVNVPQISLESPGRNLDQESGDQDNF